MDRVTEREISEQEPIIRPAEVVGEDVAAEEVAEVVVPSSIERLVGQRVNSELPNYKEVAGLMNRAFRAATIAGTKTSGEDGETIYTIAPSVKREIDGEKYLFGLRAVCSSDAVFGEPNDFIAITWQHVTGMTVDMAEIRDGALKVNLDGEESHVNEEADIAYVGELIGAFAGEAQLALQAKEAQKKRRVNIAKGVGAAAAAAVLVVAIPWGKVGSAISFDLSAPTEFDAQGLEIEGGTALEPAKFVKPEASEVLQGTQALGISEVPYLNESFGGRSALYDDIFQSTDGIRQVIFWNGNTLERIPGEAVCEIVPVTQEAIAEDIVVLTDSSEDAGKLEVKLGKDNITSCWNGGEIAGGTFARVVFSQS